MCALMLQKSMCIELFERPCLMGTNGPFTIVDLHHQALIGGFPEQSFPAESAYVL